MINSLSTWRAKTAKVGCLNSPCTPRFGNFVLVASLALVKLPKLVPLWIGPYHGTKTIDDRVYEVEQFVTVKKFEVDTSPVQFYNANKLNVHIQLTEQIHHDEWEFHVGRTVDHRRTDGQFQLKMRWSGLEEEMWEPFDSIAADVQALVQQYVKNGNVDEAGKKNYSSLTAV